MPPRTRCGTSRRRSAAGCGVATRPGVSSVPSLPATRDAALRADRGSRAAVAAVLGLSYTSQSWSYKPVGLYGQVLGPVATATTEARRDERRQAARARYAERRPFLLARASRDTGN